jgi:hypothetical protein
MCHHANHCLSIHCYLPQVMPLQLESVVADTGSSPAGELALIAALQAGLLPPCPYLQQYHGAYIVEPRELCQVSCRRYSWPVWSHVLFKRCCGVVKPFAPLRRAAPTTTGPGGGHLLSG